MQEGGYDLANVGGAVTATMKVGTETIVYTCCSRARSSAKLPARTLRSHLALDIAAALLHPANPPPAGSLLCAWGPPCVTTALTALNSSLARWCPLPFPQGFCETAVQPEPEAADDAPREDPAAAPEGVSAGESAGAGEGAAGSAGEGDDSSAAREDAGGAAEGASPPRSNRRNRRRSSRQSRRVGRRWQRWSCPKPAHRNCRRTGLARLWALLFAERWTTQAIGQRHTSPLRAYRKKYVNGQIIFCETQIYKG